MEIDKGKIGDCGLALPVSSYLARPLLPSMRRYGSGAFYLARCWSFDWDRKVCGKQEEISRCPSP